MNDCSQQRQPRVIKICISSGGIPKYAIDSVFIAQSGLAGDAHNHLKHNNPDQAVCLQDLELLEQLCEEGFVLTPGTIGENLTVQDLHVQRLYPGTILEFSGGVVLELTRERKPCYVLDSIDLRLKDAILGRCGFYAKVLREGTITSGAKIEKIILPVAVNSIGPLPVKPA